MNRSKGMKTAAIALVVCIAFGFGSQIARAQAPPSFPPEELDRIVSRIALYPDPLIAQILTASTYSDQIPDAAKWADEHHELTGDALAKAISDDQLPWDPSVQALLPFPSVLELMSSDMMWTSELGNAVLAQRDGVMDAIQRMRQKARDFGYLRSGGQIIVSGGPYITIMPANPAFIIVPAYDPLIVFAAPRPGFFIGGAIRFGFGVSIGLAFRPWGWGSSSIVWGGHLLIINNVRWDRTWVNRTTYVHPYPGVRRFEAGHPMEHHALQGRSEREREGARAGRKSEEEHRR